MDGTDVESMKRHAACAAAVVLMAIGAAGCSPAVAVHEPAIDPQAAILTNDGSSHIWVQSLDGRRLGVPSHGRYRLEPGRHTVRIQYGWTRDSIEWTGNDLVDYAFEARPGTALRIVCEHAEEPTPIRDIDHKGTWRFWIEDAAIREIVAAPECLPIPTRGATGVWQEPLFPFW
ncbi:MAG TPA: hypothetical protein VN436_02190 [Holophaga sp.]|nr:hypothetical protein [Holophaga sp.]